ncbi:MAG TPA: carboxypeptidase-like regulatory domain-containing protein, partial [Kofleriaceae bacterium]
GIVPPQTIDFDLPGGADYSLSSLSLQGGELSAVVVEGPDSEPLSGAYLRAVPLGAGPELWVERFSQEDGEVNLRLLAGTLDLLVVPDAADLPALLVDNVLPADLTGALAIDDGVLVTGTVTDPAGDPLAGARVQVTVGGAPSTIGTTSGGGAFSLRARAGGPVEVSVTPPEVSGLPALQIASGPSIADGSALAIEYDTGLDVRTVSPVLRETDGTTPAAGARVTFIANPIAGAGTISVDGTPLDAAGALVRTAQANGAGVIPDQVVTATRYDVIVEPGAGAPAGEAVRFDPLDLRTGQGAPASLRLAAPGHITGTVVDAAGAPVEGARVAAAPGGLLARATAAGAAGTSGEDGSFDLRVAAGGSYQVRVDGPGSAGRVLLAAEADDAPLSAALPPTLRLGGELTVAGGNRVEGALVQLHCLTCGPDGGPAVVAEAVSDASGAFSMLAPDPGVAE